MSIFAKISGFSGIGKREIKFIVPIFVEQALGTLVSILGTILITGVGSYAVSGVGLVDSINLMVMSVFTAVSTGITVVTAQLIGKNDQVSAEKAGGQAITVTVLLAAAMSLILLVFKRSILSFLYGGAEQNVLDAAGLFIIYTASSFPFLALSSAISGIMRASGNGRTPMMGALTANIIYIGLSSLLIRSGLGITGLGIGLLSARVCSALFMYLMMISSHLQKPGFRLKLDLATLRPVMKIAVPSGADSIIFNGGKLLVAVFMSGMGTHALAANAIGNSLMSFLNLPGNTLSIASVTIVGQMFGSGRIKETKRSMMRITATAVVLQIIIGGIFYVLTNPIISMYNPEPEAAAIARSLVYVFLVISLIWPSSFLLAQTLRATGDVTHTMVISVVSMFTMRVFGAWLLGVYFGWGVLGIWVAMGADWILRSLFFIYRVLSGRWYKKDESGASAGESAET